MPSPDSSKAVASHAFAFGEEILTLAPRATKPAAIIFPMLRASGHLCGAPFKREKDQQPFSSSIFLYTLRKPAKPTRYRQTAS